MIYPLLKSALVVRKALGATPEAHLFAEIIPAISARAALEACNANLKGNSVADGEARHVGANSNDLPGRLVAEGQWLAGAEVAVGELLVVRDIGATDAGALDGDLKLADAGFVDIPVLLEDELILRPRDVWMEYGAWLRDGDRILV
jgi:hypothetical protein